MVLIVAFVLTLVATPMAMALARHAGLLDHPGELKVQNVAIPYLGGLGVAAGVAAGLVPGHLSLFPPLGMALALGIVDDARPIGAGTRLVAELVVGLATAAVMPVRLAGPLATVAVTAAVVLLVNGVNMVDGLDGLAGGVALMSAVGYAVVLDGEGRSLALALAGALAAFLVFNRPPAKVYLGDGGAYLVGAALAVLLASTWSPERPLAVSLGSLPMVACPAGEVIVAVLRRGRSRARLLAGDRRHVYDQLVDGGWSANRAVVIVVLVQAFLGAVAVGATQLSAAAAGVVAGASAVALLGMCAALGFLSPADPETAA